ncbi:MAG TPA: hypothetical protein DCZ10_01450, partial [Pelotomaculum sp.]|nr:hypothetical protein [Pelotomaculum sp.]
HRPAVVGISSFVTSFANGLRVARLIKKALPGAKVAMGGPHVTFIPGEALATGDVDAVILFEGDETFPAYVQAVLGGEDEPGRIPGLAYRAEGTIIFSPPRPLIEDLDRLPFPARDLFRLERYRFKGNVATGRGCPYSCIFCAAGKLGGGRYRMRSVDNVLAELVELNRRYGVDRLLFYDDTLIYNEKRIFELCRGIRKHNLAFQWGCFARGNRVPREVIEEIKASGCTGVSIGIESGDDEVLRRVKKRVSVEECRETVLSFRKNGLGVKLFFIIGHPGETAEQVRKTIRLAGELSGAAPDCAAPPVIVDFSIMTPLPGSEMYERREELGLRILTDKWDRYNFNDPVMETGALRKEEIKNLYMEATEELCHFMQTRDF